MQKIIIYFIIYITKLIFLNKKIRFRPTDFGRFLSGEIIEKPLTNSLEDTEVAFTIIIKHYTFDMRLHLQNFKLLTFTILLHN